MKSNNLKLEHREIKQSSTRTQWNQTFWNQNAVKSNNPKPEHSDIKQSQTKAQWNQTSPNQNTVKSNNPKPKHCELKQLETTTQWNQIIRPPTSQRRWAGWLMFVSFVVFWNIFRIETKHYICNDVFFLNLFWDRFCNGFGCFYCQIMTCVSLNEFLLSGGSQPTSRPARGDELAGSDVFVWFAETSS